MVKLKCKTCKKEYETRFFDPKYVLNGFCSEECLPDLSYLLHPDKIPKNERLSVGLEFIKQEVNSNRNKAAKTYYDGLKKVLTKKFFKDITIAIAYFLFLIYILTYSLNLYGFDHTIVIIAVYFIVTLGGLSGRLGEIIKQLEKLNA